MSRSFTIKLETSLGQKIAVIDIEIPDGPGLPKVSISGTSGLVGVSWDISKWLRPGEKIESLRIVDREVAADENVG